MNFDLIVIGSGSGGIATAIRAAFYGAKVAVIEASQIGGTCVNLGCIPKKIIHQAAFVADSLKHAVEYGFSSANPYLDWPIFVTKREKYLESLRLNYTNKLKQAGVTYLEGVGKITNPNTVGIQDKFYTASHIVIATGSRPYMPDIPGVEYALDSNGFFALTHLPKNIAIVGNGYIAMEFASAMNHLGVETHLFVRKTQLLSKFDPILGMQLQKSFEQRGIKIHSLFEPQAIYLQENQQKTLVNSANYAVKNIDAVVMAVGRKPNLQALNLENHSMEFDKGFIKVDAFQNTSMANIYALGDVTNRPALTPVAIAAGRKLADRLFNQQIHACLDYRLVSSVVFTHPPIATIGLSEQEAKAQYPESELIVYQTQFNPLAEAFYAIKTPVVIKLITLGQEQRIIGLHLIGTSADEILQGFAVAITMGATKADFDQTMAIHPTIAEELVTLK